LLRRLHDRLRRPLLVLRYAGVQPAQRVDLASARRADHRGGVDHRGSVDQRISADQWASTEQRVDIAEFETQMKYLSEHFTPVALSTVAVYLSGKLTMPKRPVVITFDNLSAIELRSVLPVLNQTGVPATVFLPAAASSAAPVLAAFAASAAFAGSAHSAIEFGATDIAGSKAAIEIGLGVSMCSFAYRSVEDLSNDETILKAALAGYRLAVTPQHGVNWLGSLSPMTLSRVTVAGGLSSARFRTLIDLPRWAQRADSTSISRQT
jgi:Polysaccharide deacetylase